MKRMPFERPTEYYDERISKIDEQICEMLKFRKQLLNNNPGFPPFEYISKWAETFELYEDFLKAVFGTLRSEDYYKPIIEPSDFRKHITVLKSVEEGSNFELQIGEQYDCRMIHGGATQVMLHTIM